MNIRGLPCLLLLLVAAWRTVPAASDSTSPVLVLASGETHAMLRPCDCPDAPGGGLAERAALVDRIRDSAAVLLLDAGGFAGGGVYDTYTEGRDGDSVRTIAAIRAMGRMGYDAVVVGDDDLQFGASWLADQAERAGVPLVCANGETDSGSTVFAPYRVVERGGLTFAVTGVTTPERLFPTDTAVRIVEPLAALRAVLPPMAQESDYQVVLSHLGEEQTEVLADSLEGVDLIINGHRKASHAPLVWVGGIPVVQFGYQGKALARVTLDSAGGSVVRGAAWVPVDGTAGASPRISALLDSTDSYDGMPPYDLYLMSQCPYGLEALEGLVAFVSRFPRTEWNLWFVGSVDDRGMESLHGPGEIADEKLWLAIRALYPQRWLDFLAVRASVGIEEPTIALATHLGLDTAALRSWAERYGDERLAMHYRRSMRLGVNASPTLAHANAPLDIEVTAQRLTWHACHAYDSGADACDSLPECLDDGDCRKPGKLGRCSRENGKPACVYRDAIRFDFVVVGPEQEPGPDERSIMSGTKELFPGAAVERIVYETRRGRKLVEEAGVDALPLYLFGHDVERAVNFIRVRDDVRSVGRYYTFKDGVVPRTYFHRRPRKAGNTVLFVDPLLPAIDEVLRDALAAGGGLEIHPMVFSNPSEPIESAEERFRAEEAQRWLVLKKHFPEAYHAYLAGYAARPGSSYWTSSLKEAGIDIETFTNVAERDSTLLTQAWELRRQLEIRTPVAMLVDNRRVVALESPRQLARALKERGRG